MVSNGHFPAQFAKGNLKAQLPFTTTIHYPPPWNPPVLASQSWNLANTSCSDAIPTWVVVLAMLLVFLSTPSATQSKLEAPSCNPSAKADKHGPQQAFTKSGPPVKMRKLSQCWSIAIVIQQHWYNAWDLTTHWNVENLGSWGLASLSQTAVYILPFSHRLLPSAKASTHSTFSYPPW